MALCFGQRSIRAGRRFRSLLQRHITMSLLGGAAVNQHIHFSTATTVEDVVIGRLGRTQPRLSYHRATEHNLKRKGIGAKVHSRMKIRPLGKSITLL